MKTFNPSQSPTIIFPTVFHRSNLSIRRFLSLEEEMFVHLETKIVRLIRHFDYKRGILVSDLSW